MLLFLSHASCFLSNYSLLPPFKTTSYNEVGMWTLRGSCIPQKRHLKLTSLPNEKGGACLRAPTTFTDWEAEYAFQNVPLNTSRTNVFIFSDKLCPDSLVITSGIMLKTIEEANSTNISIYITIKGSNKNIHNQFIGIFNTSKDKEHIGLKVKYIQNELSIYYGNKKYNEVYRAEGKISCGYFSIFSDMKESTNTNNLLYFVVSNHSLVNLKENESSILEHNRKILSKSRYHFLNSDFRRLHMKKSLKYYNEKQGRHDNLTNCTSAKFHNSFLEIKETVGRAALGITAKEINEYALSLANYLQEKSFKSYDQISKDAKEMSESLAILYNQVFSFIREQQLSIEEYKREIRKSVLNLEEMIKSKSDVPLELEVSRYNNTIMGRILWPIAVAEFISYIIFVIAMHKYTHGFKKTD